MQTQTTSVEAQGRYVRANGIEIYYVEAGQGRPLILLHGGLVSTNPIWNGIPVSYASHMETLAQRFRVIAPDTRGSGRTVHSGGTITFEQLADDVLALAEALDLEKPLLAGFSEGALTATIAGIRKPDAVGAIVCDAGHDLLNPSAPSMAMMRQTFGGSPQATETDVDATELAFAEFPPMKAMFELMKADQDGGQGPGHWKTYLSLAFARTTQPPGYTFDDLATITAPTLILVGDRDHFCSVEEAVLAYRKLEKGELAVLPNTGHEITPEGVASTIEFLVRASDVERS
jgi:pimeloyl-ACP methyl ester carboxylesterase